MKLSIITICFNNLKGLQNTLESVFAQTYKEFELIVIDGGSTDGSKEYIQSKSEFISFWCSEKDNGIYHAQNKGLEKASGKYCLFLNSGDFLFSSDVLQNVFSQNAVEDIIYGNMLIREKSGQERIGKMPEHISFHHMIADTLWHPVSFIRKDLFIRYGVYDESLKMVADYDFFLKAIILHNASTRHCGLVVSVFTLDGFSSDFKNKALQAKERAEVQSRYFPEKVIQSAQQFIRLKNSRWYKLALLLKLIREEK